MQRLATLFLIGCVGSLSSRAQSFNIDIGDATVAPSPALAGAAMQPGTWNPVPVSPSGGSHTALLDVSGAPTSVTIRQPLGGQDFYYDNPTTLGDDGILLDDGEFPPTGYPTEWFIVGLVAGTYHVYTYGWASDSPTFLTGVSVNHGPVTTVGGTWTGAYQLGVTHAHDIVTIPAGGNITIGISTVSQYATFNGVQLHLVGTGGTPFTPVCPGDGSGSACPCGNSGVAGNGCANSVSSSGASLTGSGNPNVFNDTFVLTASLMPNGSALYFQGTEQMGAGTGVALGDGLRCAGGSVIRLGTKTNVNGMSSYPGGSDPGIAVKGANYPGSMRTYQVWYRNAASFCTSATFNLTNGLAMVWVP